jgi:hypothetical protein
MAARVIATTGGHAHHLARRRLRPAGPAGRVACSRTPRPASSSTPSGSRPPDSRSSARPESAGSPSRSPTRSACCRRRDRGLPGHLALGRRVRRDRDADRGHPGRGSGPGRPRGRVRDGLQPRARPGMRHLVLRAWAIIGAGVCDEATSPGRRTSGATSSGRRRPRPRHAAMSPTRIGWTGTVERAKRGTGTAEGGRSGARRVRDVAVGRAQLRRFPSLVSVSGRLLLCDQPR